MDLIQAILELRRWEKRARKLEAALQKIAEYEIDWAAGPSENVNALAAIAEKALEQP